MQSSYYPKLEERIKPMKKLLLMSLFVILCFQLTACSSEESKREKAKEEAMALIGNELESGELVIDGTKYAFPSVISEWTESGWHISNNYENADTFELEFNVESNEFELFNDEKESAYVGMCAINLGNEPVKIAQAETSFLEVNLSPKKDGVFVVLPGGITCDSTKEDVIAAYGEPDEEDDGLLYYTYTNADGLDILVEIRVSFETVDRIQYKMDDSNWGFVTNAEECSEFVDSALRASFYGDYAVYVEKKFDTEENAQLLYETEVDYYSQALMYYLSVDYETVSDDIAEGFREISRKVIEKVKWDAPVSDLGDGAILGSVEITMYPVDFLDIILEDVQAVADSGVEGDEYARGMLDAITPWVEQTSHQEPITKTYDVDLNNGVITTEDWDEIDDILMDLAE